jgi:CRP-like cAMP-binding protein
MFGVSDSLSLRQVTPGADAMDNRLLALLSQCDREILLRDAVSLSLPSTRRLYRRGQEIDAIYFPLDCVVSLVIDADGKTPFEMATIGNEGAVGVLSILNPCKAIGNMIVQVAGEALRLGRDQFMAYIRTNAAFERLIHRYIFALVHQIVQAGACNQAHTIDQRCARWLLMTQDRKGTDTFELTQQYLADMLAVRRATVNTTVGRIKAAGMIKYVRGKVTILNRPGLEAFSCGCYRVIRKEYENLSLQ